MTVSMNENQVEKNYFYKKKFNDKPTQKVWDTLNKINEKYPYSMLQYAKLVLIESRYKIK